MNEETDKINTYLFGSNENNNDGINNYDKFNKKLCKKQIQIITKFIKNWHGLKIPEAAKLPARKNQYREKAQSWLNGRRAMQYSINLYPVMLKKAHKVKANL